jgi:hypothetical protein
MCRGGVCLVSAAVMIRARATAIQIFFLFCSPENSGLYQERNRLENTFAGTHRCRFSAPVQLRQMAVIKAHYALTKPRITYEEAIQRARS